MGLVFIHIGKTGGTALHTSLANALGKGICSPPFVQSYMTRAEADHYNNFPIICGHISRVDQQKWFPHRGLLTVLRTPLERAFSFLHYVRSLPEDAAPIAYDAKRMSLMELIETEEAQRNLNNTMVRQLGGHMLDNPTDFSALLSHAEQTLTEALWVGFQHRLEQDYPRLQRLLGFAGDLRIANETAGRPPLEAEDPKVVNRLLELSVYDRALWSWALERADRLGKQDMGATTSLSSCESLPIQNSRERD
jgi:hypothetical protein